MISGIPAVDRLLLAIGEHEGWYPLDSQRSPKGSRAYRNHNPGNLRSSPFQSGMDGGFAVFRNDLIGWNALHWDIMQKSKGKTVTNLGPKSTLRELIFVYAPPSDNNDSEAYLANVTKKTGLKESVTLAEIFKTP